MQVSCLKCGLPIFDSCVKLALIQGKDSLTAMEFLSNKPLLITDTILRDAHQSQAATRMTLDDMLPACEILDSIGYYSLECWGGATFDACLRFLNEDPWERLRQLRAHLPHTKLQMLFRGQNILGYKH